LGDDGCRSADDQRTILERKTLYLKLHPETKHGGAPGKAGGGKKAKDAKLASFVKLKSNAFYSRS
jgi:hypothetical protein